VSPLGEVKKPKYGPAKNPQKTQDEFNAVTAVLSSTHHGIHPVYPVGQ